MTTARYPAVVCLVALAVAGCSPSFDDKAAAVIRERLAYLSELAEVKSWSIAGSGRDIIIVFDAPSKILSFDARIATKAAAANAGAALGDRVTAWSVTAASGDSYPPKESFCMVRADKNGVFETDGPQC